MYKDIAPPHVMSANEKLRLRAAAFKVTRLYPGPIGLLLSRELLTWEEFGYRFGGSSLVAMAVEEILKTPSPEVVASMPRNVAGKAAVGYE